MTYGFKYICEFEKSWEDLIIFDRRPAKDDDREPEDIINNIRNKLKGINNERTDFSGNTDPK